VWHSRHGFYSKDLPADIAKYGNKKKSPLVIGDICKAGVAPLSELSSWTDITADNVLTVQINGKDVNAIQVSGCLSI
jgi:protein involved in sex pheromone biosynthesis